MSRTYISIELRQLVAQSANCRCEYCLISASDRLSGCHVDHIINLKHGGETTPENLAYACIFCNLNKGTDLGSIVWRTGELIRFFNPRRDRWKDHFQFDNAIVQSLTDIGEVTARIFQCAY
jgi:hypothetical protein